jgi:erythromycin esterase-like protein
MRLRARLKTRPRQRTTAKQLASKLRVSPEYQNPQNMPHTFRTPHSPLPTPEWIAREAVPFDPASVDSLSAAIDSIVNALGKSVDLLGIGEPTHGVEGFLALRNGVFRRLVVAHGFTAIALESSFPRGRVVNDFVAGASSASLDEVLDAGTSQGFGRLAANRELVEWIRSYNAEPGRSQKLRFYGFDSPTEMTGADSPRQLVEFVLDYLAQQRGDQPGGSGEAERRGRIDVLLGDEAAWANRAATFDASQSIGRSAAALELRMQVEALLEELQSRAAELSASSDVEADRYDEAVHYARHARAMLDYHAALADTDAEPGERIAQCLALRDRMMAENLAYIVKREPGRVLAFAHNSHLMCGEARWQLGPHLLKWNAAGRHMREMLGDRYAVIGVGVGVSEAMQLGTPEAGSLEAALLDAASPACWIATEGGRRLPVEALSKLVERSGTPTYFPFTRQSLEEFQVLALVRNA